MDLERKKQLQREASRRYRDRNPEKSKAACKKWRDEHPGYQKKWQEKNPEKYRAIVKKTNDRESNKLRQMQWRTDNPDKVKSAWQKANAKDGGKRSKKWRDKNPHKVAEMASRRRARIKNACPMWADMDNINMIYAAAAMMRITGFTVDVDHIIPLKGKAVSGLHVENNLRIISTSENRKKYNKLIEA